MTIPKILHFMWLDKNKTLPEKIPDKYLDNIKQFEQLNPDFKIKLWFNSNTEALLKLYPEYNNFYNSKFNLYIMKCDFARMVILYHYGGIYSDLDFYCVRSLDPLTIYNNFFVYEPKEHLLEMKKSYPGLISNGFLGSMSRGIIIKNFLDYMIVKSNINSNDAVKYTGPAALYSYLNSINFKNANIIDNCLIIPYYRTGLLSDSCKDVDYFVYTKWNEGTNWIQTTRMVTTKYSIDNKNISLPTVNYIKYILIILLFSIPIFYFYKQRNKYNSK